ncbi:hypothetical protein PACTADRAFT_80065 [Pachysolen tannophilus NRRL Y-2460]|uniref:RGS domain-containing protein n=1 Tax=Pachysolen tannophilus NRRL Y-2460 TaxID=669874 RepID=A0A1E4TW78_PACTA|nr:hypothetical protein PACTADRAFT_80065 [Pachysolen tannophilus NRRL Y-2460]
MDFLDSTSYVNAGLPKVTTLSSSLDTSTTLNNKSNENVAYQDGGLLVEDEIPPLELVLAGSSSSPYSRNNFAKFLLNRHCLENLEFYLEIERFQQLSHPIEKEYSWKFLSSNFIEADSPKEVNLPSSVKNELVSSLIPTNEALEEATKVIVNLLHDGYVEFTSSKIREHNESLQKQSSDKSISEYYYLASPSTQQSQPQSQSKSQSQLQIQAQAQAPQPQSNSHSFNGRPNGRCISPLSPEDSTAGSSTNHDDNEFPFLMSDNEEQSDVPSINSNFHRENSNIATTNSQRQSSVVEDVLETPPIQSTNMIRNSSVTSINSASRSSLGSIFAGSFKNSNSLIGNANGNNDSNWKKAAKKLKWRRLSTNSSTEA